MSRQTCSLPTTVPDTALGLPARLDVEEVTCDGILKQPEEEFHALRLQLVQRNNVHCCR